MREHRRKEEWVLFLSGKLLYFFLGLCDFSDKFPKMFCSSCSGERRQPQISVINFSQVSNKAASSVDEEKLFKKYFHRAYPYAALIMCTNDYGSGCFEVLWCILSLMLGASD